MRHVLVIDDSRTILTIAKGELERDYIVTTALSGKEGLFLLERFTPDLILLDINMPNMDGKEFLKILKSEKRWSEIPVIFLTGDTDPQTEEECLRLGADDYISKPFVPIVMRRRISRIIELYKFRKDLENRVKEKTKQVELVTLNSIMVIANVIDAKDAYTAGHSIRVAQCAEDLSKQLGWDEEKRMNLHYVALLHDIGKIGIKDAILNKPLALTEEEFNVIRKHPVMGGEILKDIHMIPHLSEGALYHHERFDGRGYPTGLKGKSIPEFARVITIADTYDAMSSRRVYRDKLDRDVIIKEFVRCNGAQFDPEFGDVFIEMLKDGYSLEHNNSNEFDLLSKENSIFLNHLIENYNGEIIETSLRDSLTGFYNKRFFEEKIGKVWSYYKSGALFIIDMDNFNRINESYGHIMGDHLLRTLGNVLNDTRGNNDVIGRISGDKFVMFCPDEADREKLEARAKEIIEKFKKVCEPIEIIEENISVSIGISTYPDNGDNYSVLYRNTDYALYYVKENGKNGYHFYGRGITDVVSNDNSADINCVRSILEGKMSKEEGALNVEFSDFQKIYDFISRCVAREKKEVQTMLFTLESEDSRFLPLDLLERGMDFLERAIVSSLRAMDVSARYSSSQYVVILMDANSEGGDIVANRICAKFNELYHRNDILISTDIQTMVAGEKLSD